MATTITFHDGTAYNASATLLAGAQTGTQNNNALLFWFVPASAYDGTITLQISPNVTDASPTWFPLDFYETGAITTVIHTLASPGTTKAYIAAVPGNVQIRISMAGGSVGSLSAYGQLTSFIPA